jgi:hypothetical protein
MEVFDTLAYLFILGICATFVFVLIWVAVVLHVKREEEEENSL